MTPSEFERFQEEAKTAYEQGRITAGDFRQIMEKLGFRDRTIDDYLENVDRHSTIGRR